MTPISYFCYCI